jgi:translation initiation factor IF-3
VADFKFKEEMRKKKIEDQQRANQMKLKEQEIAATKRRQDLESRERMRVMYLEAQN